MDPLGTSGNTLAAWLQAIGSVLAIVAAIILSWWQHIEARRNANRQQEHARYERIDGLGGLMESVYSEIYKAHCAAFTSDWRQYISFGADIPRLKRAVEALERAPLHEAGNWRIVQAAIATREAGFKALDLLSQGREFALAYPSANTEDVELEIRRTFDIVNKAMAPVIRALAYDWFEVGPLSEWKEHLDLPEGLIPKHRRPPSLKRANALLRKQWRRQKARERREVAR